MCLNMERQRNCWSRGDGGGEAARRKVAQGRHVVESGRIRGQRDPYQTQFLSLLAELPVMLNESTISAKYHGRSLMHWYSHSPWAPIL